MSEAEKVEAPVDDNAAKEPVKDEKPVSEKKANDDKKAGEGDKLVMKDPFAEEPYVASEISDKDMYNLSPCCCCMCACSHDRVGAATCFGCLPIRCGVMFIAMQIFALAVILITVTFFQLLNEYLPWWFSFITLLLLSPLIISASQMVYFFAKDSRGTRGNMFGAVILSIISVSLWCLWNLIFFLAIYKRDIVYTGMGAANDESNYHATPKRTYLFTVLAETTFILTWLTYYTCVANQYWSLMNEKYDRQKKEDEADKKKAEKKKEDEAKEAKRLAAEAKK